MDVKIIYCYIMKSMFSISFVIASNTFNRLYISIDSRFIEKMSGQKRMFRIYQYFIFNTMTMGLSFNKLNFCLTSCNCVSLNRMTG